MNTNTNIGTETSLDSVEAEFQEVRDELKEILFDIRIYLMEAQTPIPNDLDRERLREELETERG
ncbi:MAG TPA: hypothetical protein VMW86_02480 [Dehalococcoidales bacterium]|nr:hypothetical protein [Dehalococcoidales bacterium]